jgi:hypothetical protein
VSIRPRYGSNGARGRSAYGRPTPEPGRLSWRDMRPVLLKSAGIVGLAGAIMAVVSSNALFVDPGGPDRPSQHAAGEARNDPAPIVIAATSPTPEAAEADQIATLLQTNVGAEARPTADAVQPETTASVVPAEPRILPPVSQPVAEAPAPPPAPSNAIADAPSAPPPPVETAAVPPPPAAPATVALTLATAEPVQPVADKGPTVEDRGGPVSALWPKDSVECPRDWVAPTVEGNDAKPPAGCETIAALVQPDDNSAETLSKALPEKVLDLVALAPTIPVPKSANPDATPSDTSANADAKPQPKPTPVRANRASSWPGTPPPDCGDKHAYWHFVQGHHGAKEWYCK